MSRNISQIIFTNPLIKTRTSTNDEHIYLRVILCLMTYEQQLTNACLLSFFSEQVDNMYVLNYCDCFFSFFYRHVSVVEEWCKNIDII